MTRSGLAVCLFVPLTACSSDVVIGQASLSDGTGTGTGTDTEGAADSTTGVATSAGAGPDVGGQATTDVDPPVHFDLGGTPGVDPEPGPACSADLRDVLDPATGEIVQTCGVDEGCNDGMCVPACTAAALAQGSKGCEFLVATPPFYLNHWSLQGQDGPCHALLVANPWPRPATLQIRRDGIDYDAGAHAWLPSGIGAATQYAPLPADGIPSGEVAVVFLSHRPGSYNGIDEDTGEPISLECPREPVVLADTAAHGSDRGTAFAIASDTPVQVYDMLPYGGALTWLPSASMIHPSTAIGDSYLVSSPHCDVSGAPDVPCTESGPEWMIAVARDDDTTIRIAPTTPLYPGVVPDSPVGVVTEHSLDAGEFIQFMSDGDPVGSIIEADAPIAVLAGSSYLYVTTEDPSTSGQDSAHQMLADVHALGSEYVGAGLVSRLADHSPESVRYRLVGVVDGTDLEWDGDVDDAPATLDAGEVFEFETRAPFAVRSQGDSQPISLSQYMSGGIEGQEGCTDYAMLPCYLGDEEWVTLVPPQQYLRDYPFFVDPTYPNATLVLVRVRGEAGFADVDVACMGTIDGWQPVGGDGRYEVAHVELFRGFDGEHDACETSQHSARSAGDFGVMVWGTDRWSSYAYPAGGGFAALNDVQLDPEG